MRSAAVRAAAIALLLSGCVSNFVNHAKVSTDSSVEMRERLFRTAEEIATQYRLQRDPGASEPPVRQGYFGPKYHYYTFSTRELDGRLLVAFVHEARMSHRAEDGSAPVRSFVERVETSFDPAVVTVETNLK